MKKYIYCCFGLILVLQSFKTTLMAGDSFSMYNTLEERLDDRAVSDSLHFYIDESEGVQDFSTYVVPVAVNNCSGVSDFQFTLALEGNPLVSFNAIVLIDNFPGQLSTTISPDNKQVEISWSVNGGITLPDSSAVLEIELSLNATGGCADLKFINTPLVIEATLTNGLTFVPSKEDAAVCFIPPGYISGNIYTEDNVGVAGVEVRCIGPDTTFLATTNQEGSYEFFGLTLNEDYLVIPFSDGEVGNGVTIFDILQIRDYILSSSPGEILNSPYQLIAADVSGNGSIGLLDVLQIRDVRLELLSEFSGVLSWIFIPVDYDFLNAENPWQENYPQTSTVNNLPGIWLDLDFIAIKSGDVNRSATPYAGP